MDKGNFTVYKSSAGSGKTFTLVREYLKLVLAAPEKFRHILAITFTNRAANEMKERVLQYLCDFSTRDFNSLDGPARQMMEMIIPETGLEKEDIRTRAGVVLNNILHNYTEFAIGTIDSFTHKITRIFAFDLKLPLNFEVEMDTEQYLSEVIRKLIERVGKDPELTEVLVGFLDQKLSEEKSWKIENDLKATSKVLLQEGSQKYIDKLFHLTQEDFRRIRQAIFAEIAGIEKTLRKQAHDALEMIGEKDIDHTSFSYGVKGLPGYFRKFLQRPMKMEGPNSYVEKTFSEEKWTSAKASGEDREKIMEISSVLTDIFNRTENFRAGHVTRYNLLKIIAERIFQVTVLNEISKIIDELRDEKNIVHISEFNERISKIIASEPIPFIYERMGEKYRHILIDEFQDTSQLQWSNLLPLVENALASNNFNLVVGDTKQSIYRFRDGDPDQFENLPAVAGDGDEIQRQRENVLKQHYFKVELGENYRSSPDIVGFNNEFFSYARQFLPEEYRKYYDNVNQVAARDFPGEVHISFLDDDFEMANYAGVLETIGKLIAEGYAYRDIAILCRANDKASGVARHLLQEGINVVSSDSLLVSGSPDVRFMVSWFRLLFDHNDHVAAAHILAFLVSKGKFTGKGLDDLLKELEKNSGNPFYNVLDILSDEGTAISESRLRNQGLADLAEFLVRTFCPGGGADPYLVFFLDLISVQSLKGNDSISLFLEWWDDHAAEVSIAVPENIDAVRVMTIHKAKGLQFPVVIFPFADSKIRTTKNEVWIDLEKKSFSGLPVALARTSSSLRDSGRAGLYDTEYNKSMVDFMNLLYVVMTRPQEKLYIFTRREEKIKEIPGDTQQLFYSFLINKHDWDMSGTSFFYGRKVPKKVTVKKEDETTTQLMPFELSDWHRRVLLSFNAPEYWDVADPSGQGRWGTLVHLVLSRIDVENDVGSVLEGLVDEGVLLPEESREMLPVLNRLFEDPAVAGLFDEKYKVIAEREIIGADGHIYRPDRIMIRGKEAVVVDFKTGRPGDEHRKQIRRYGDLLRQTGYDVKDQYLLYIADKPELVRVDD